MVLHKKEIIRFEERLTEHSRFTSTSSHIKATSGHEIVLLLENIVHCLFLAMQRRELLCSNVQPGPHRYCDKIWERDC